MAYSLTRYTPYYYDPVIVSTYTDEYYRMKDALRSNQQAVERMIDSVREERERTVANANLKCSVLQSRVSSDAARINNLESDLTTWKSRFSDMHSRFDTLKHTLERKDYTMDKMKEELDRCNATVQEVVTKSKIAQNEYHKMASDLKWKTVHWANDVRAATRDAAIDSMRHLTRFRPLSTYSSQYDLYDPRVKVYTHYY